MSIPLLCLLFAALMVLITKVPVAMAQARESGGYDNRHPRAQQARLEGFGARALAAHQNMIEAFPMFAAGLLAALWAGAEMQWVTGLAVVFIAARIAYTVFYLGNFHVLRSFSWGLGFFASIGLMVLALA
ncbi:MAG: MAPEG family protein [Wenzhouxiangellaceae bacterium]|nr:MAPEG family protein [Wenzhouxiangellaceae bacterium]